ncbi:MAG TPA: glycosyltransferase family A protein [Pelolinea sp.]|nr:glycosyltransferase family A protein [Pelolinea sp.]
MPRIGMNPGRGKKSSYQPARVTVAVLTHIPNQIGYFKDRLLITRTCLESIITNTTAPYDLMVFDNGSCSEAVAMLNRMRDEGKIDFLVLSGQNIGKIGALQVIYNAAPGEVIAYSDDDVFFLPGWLEQHLQVIDTYPNVGVVTGMYIKPHMKEGISSTVKFASRQGLKSEHGNLVDEAWERHYIEQMGRTWERYQEEIEGLEDIRLTYKGIQTFVSAGHYQMTTFKTSLLKAMPENWSGNLMGQMRDLDVAIDKLGMLRLCTTPPTVRLLGNLIDEKSANELREYGVNVQGNHKAKEPSAWKKMVYRNPLVQKIAYFFYERLFKIINT